MHAHLTGIDIDYTYEIANLWVDPRTRFSTNCPGITGLGAFCRRFTFLVAAPWLVSAALFPAILVALVLVPMAALLGFAEVGMTMTSAREAIPNGCRRIKARGVPADPDRAELRAH